VWFAAAVARDHENVTAKDILQSEPDHATTDHVLVETWLLLRCVDNVYIDVNTSVPNQPGRR
jgi:predicted nucleic acid-binding protein